MAIELVEQEGAFVTLGLQCGHVEFALLARRCQLEALGLNLLLNLGELAEIGHQTIDAINTGALEIAVIGEHARNRADIVLLQQQLELFAATERIG